MSIEAMKQALEALEMLARYENPETRVQVRKPKDGGPIVTMYPHKVATDAAIAIRTAIAEVEKQEPVLKPCWYESKEKTMCRKCGQVHAEAIPPAAQRQWVGLTDEEVKDIVWNLPYEPSQEHIRAIEAKLKEKNT